MNRRVFLAAMPLAPLVAVPAVALPAVAAVPKAGLRLSALKDDPGYRAWCELCGDGKTVKVYLDGVEQHDAVTADEADGMVYRAVRTPSGNLAIGRDEILYETVYGDVRIVIS